MSERGTWILWGLYALVVVVVKYTDAPPPGDVFHIYREGGASWLAGRDLFEGSGNAFNYLPTAALPFLPFALLPFGVGGAIWRLLNLLIFALGTSALARACRRPDGPSPFPLASLVAMALSWSAARHGQMTLVMAGCMMLGVAALDRGQHWRAAVLMTLSIAFKPLAVFVLVVSGLASPRLAWRVAVCMALGAALPFALQSPDYVLRQYAEVPSMLRLVAERAEQPGHAFAQLYTLLESCGLSLGQAARLGIQVVIALPVIGLCWLARRRDLPPSPGASFYTLAVLATLLLSPVTEHNTYALMSPALGLFAALAWFRGSRRTFYTLLGLALLCLLNRSLGRAFPGTPLALLKPLAAAVFLALAAFTVAARRAPADG